MQKIGEQGRKKTCFCEMKYHKGADFSSLEKKSSLVGSKDDKVADRIVVKFSTSGGGNCALREDNGHDWSQR